MWSSWAKIESWLRFLCQWPGRREHSLIRSRDGKSGAQPRMKIFEFQRNGSGRTSHEKPLLSAMCICSNKLSQLSPTPPFQALLAVFCSVGSTVALFWSNSAGGSYCAEFQSDSANVHTSPDLRTRRHGKPVQQEEPS